MTYPWATTARAPGHNCLSAASRAPGHGRPLAAQRAAGRDRLSAALRAPGAGRTPRHHGQGAGSASSACRTYRHRALAGRPAPAAPGSLAPCPCQSPHPDLSAHPPRHRPEPRQARPPSQPSFLFPPSSFPRKRESTSPRCNGGTTGGLRTGNLRCVFPHFSVPITPHHPPSASCHPGTAPPAVLLHRGHGLPTPPPPRTPAAARRKPSLVSLFPPSPPCGEGPGGGAQPHHTWQYPCGCGPSQGEAQPVPPRSAERRA